MPEPIDWPPPRRPRRRRRGLPIILGVLAVLVLGGGTLLSYYVDALWFESLGVADVFWTTLRLQGQTFTFFFVATFLALYGSYLALKPATLGELAGLPILINGQPIKLPVEPVIRIAALGGAFVIVAPGIGSGTALGPGVFDDFGFDGDLGLGRRIDAFLLRHRMWLERFERAGGLVLVDGLQHHVAFELLADVRLQLQCRHLQEADRLLQLRGHGELLTQLQLQ